jgi:hypothetical protein
MHLSKLEYFLTLNISQLAYSQLAQVFPTGASLAPTGADLFLDSQLPPTSASVPQLAQVWRKCSLPKPLIDERTDYGIT